MGGGPHPEDGFDLALTELLDGRPPVRRRGRLASWAPRSSPRCRREPAAAPTDADAVEAVVAHGHRPDGPVDGHRRPAATCCTPSAESPHWDDVAAAAWPARTARWSARRASAPPSRTSRTWQRRRRAPPGVGLVLLGGVRLHPRRPCAPRPSPATASGSPTSWPPGRTSSACSAASAAAGASRGARWASTSPPRRRPCGQRLAAPQARRREVHAMTATASSGATARPTPWPRALPDQPHPPGHPRHVHAPARAGGRPDADAPRGPVHDARRVRRRRGADLDLRRPDPTRARSSTPSATSAPSRTP